MEDWEAEVMVSSEHVLEQVEKAKGLYHRLVLLVAPSGAGKTEVLRQVASKLEFPLINVNLELSRRLLDFSAQQRALHAPNLLSDIVAQAEGHCSILDNLEVLFDPSLQLDPLRVLKGLSRHRTILASWNGNLTDSGLTYGCADHPEYRVYSPSELDFLSVSQKGEEE